MRNKTLDRDYAKRVYDWLGAHPFLYRVIRWNVCFGRERFLQEQAMDAIGIKRGDTVLDLACGAGSNLAALEKRVGSQGRIIAVDLSAGMLGAAKAKAEESGWTNIEFRETDAAEIKLAEGSLDGAICTFALSVMPGERRALQRVAEALKPGAKLVVLDAKEFKGWASIFNLLIGPLFKIATAWSYEKDVASVLRSVFPLVKMQEYHSGHNYIAVASN